MKRASQQLLSFALAFILLMGFAMPALADGETLVGEVTIINRTSVNIRSGGSTDYPIVYTGRPGELFYTTGQVSTGWYEILLPGGGYGYVSDNLVYFYPYTNNQQPQPQPLTYTLPVYYTNAQGQTVRTVYAQVSQGQNVITADDTQMPGYRLVGNRNVYVTVNNAGQATPSSVYFRYEPQATQPQAVSALVTVYYKDVYNNIVATEYLTYPQGAHLVKANTSKLPAGYYLSGASDAVVIVGSNGTATPNQVNFTVTRSATQPQQPTGFTVPVSYRDENGNVLNTTYAAVTSGYTTVTANSANVPQGYTLTSAGSVVVYTTTQGITFPSTVVFTYKAAQKATIQIIYKDNYGTIFYTENLALDPGTHTITSYNTRVPAGYVLQGNRTQNVTVYNNGTVSQNQVIFTYTLPVKVSVPVYYLDKNGTTLHSETVTLDEGTHTIRANDANVPKSYVLQSSRSVNVTVYANGSYSPNRVVFNYEQPVSAFVDIQYKAPNGARLYSETRSFLQGSHTVTADDSLAPRTYELQSARNVKLTVDAYGRANPATITFTYGPKGPPVTVNVPVVYKDQDGKVLFQSSVALSSDAPLEVRAFSSHVPAGYVLTSSSPVTVTVSSNGVSNPAQVVFTWQNPKAGGAVKALPRYQTFSLGKGTYAVYSGPGNGYYRANSNKASVSGGKLRVWGKVGNWALIGYGLTNNLYRIGYISTKAIPTTVDVPELFLGNQQVKTRKAAPLYDDPIIQPIKIFDIKAGTTVTLLAYLDDRWAYVETKYGTKPIRGFVNKANLSIP